MVARVHLDSPTITDSTNASSRGDRAAVVELLASAFAQADSSPFHATGPPEPRHELPPTTAELITAPGRPRWGGRIRRSQRWPFETTVSESSRCAQYWSEPFATLFEIHRWSRNLAYNSRSART